MYNPSQNFHCMSKFAVWQYISPFLGFYAYNVTLNIPSSSPRFNPRPVLDSVKHGKQSTGSNKRNPQKTKPWIYLYLTYSCMRAHNLTSISKASTKYLLLYIHRNHITKNGSPDDGKRLKNNKQHVMAYNSCDWFFWLLCLFISSSF